MLEGLGNLARLAASSWSASSRMRPEPARRIAGRRKRGSGCNPPHRPVPWRRASPERQCHLRERVSACTEQLPSGTPPQEPFSAVAATLADPMGAPDAVPARGRSAAAIAPLAVTAAVAVLTFLLAYDGGTFGDTSRQTLAVAVWWVVILAGVAGLWPLAGFNRTTLLAGGFLAAYAGSDARVGHLGRQRGGRLQRVQPRRPLRRASLRWPHWPCGGA